MQLVGVPINARGVEGRGGADRKGVFTYRSSEPESTFAWLRTVPAGSAGPVTGGRDVAKVDLRERRFLLFSVIVSVVLWVLYPCNLANPPLQRWAHLPLVRLVFRASVVK